MNSTQHQPPRTRFTPKNTVKRVLNLALFLGLSLMTGTGLLLAYRLPPGSRGGRGLTCLGWGRHDWGDLHLYVSYAVIALLVVHLAMNWQWLVKIASRRVRWRLVAGLCAGLGLIAIFLLLPIKRGEDDHEHAAPEPQGDPIRTVVIPAASNCNCRRDACATHPYRMWTESLLIRG